MCVVGNLEGGASPRGQNVRLPDLMPVSLTPPHPHPQQHGRWLWATCIYCEFIHSVSHVYLLFVLMKNLFISIASFFLASFTQGPQPLAAPLVALIFFCGTHPPTRPQPPCLCSLSSYVQMAVYILETLALEKLEKMGCAHWKGKQLLFVVS